MGRHRRIYAASAEAPPNVQTFSRAKKSRHTPESPVFVRSMSRNRAARAGNFLPAGNSTRKSSSNFLPVGNWVRIILTFLRMLLYDGWVMSEILPSRLNASRAQAASERVLRRLRERAAAGEDCPSRGFMPGENRSLTIQAERQSSEQSGVTELAHPTCRIQIDVPLGTPYREIQEAVFRQAYRHAGTQLRAAIALGITPETVSRVLRRADRRDNHSPGALTSPAGQRVVPPTERKEEAPGAGTDATREETPGAVTRPSGLAPEGC